MRGGVGGSSPVLCIFMDRSAVFEGLPGPCPLPDPGGNGLEPGTNKTGCHLAEDEMLR